MQSHIPKSLDDPWSKEGTKIRGGRQERLRCFGPGKAAVTTSCHQWEGHLQDIYNTLDNAGTRMPTVAPVVLQVRA